MIFSEDEVREIVGKLDEPCWNCDNDASEGCGACHGSGYMLTTAGIALLEFIRRYSQRTTNP
jgi:microsomal dipeptidase-like Zn-dependent dipeptidase